MTAPPLAGLRILELARILAGPWAGQTLADLGADVIKVERPGAGDDTRAWGPPFVPGPDGDHQDAAYFHSCNRGKRSIAVDFEQPAGQDIVRKLAARADVLIENFKVGGLAKFGLDYASLSALNPRLVYCSITGFGQTGPYAHRAGYDFMIQGMGGIMDLTGAPDGEPMKTGVAIADIFTGVYSVIAIQAALAARETTGRGQHIDMALLDTQVGVLANQGVGYLVSGTATTRLGNAHPNIVPYQVFHASDKSDGRFIGYFSFMPLPGGGDVELGARLSPRVWGRRYAVEGGRALIAYGFETLALPRIVSVFHPDNRPVRFVLGQLDFHAAPTPETVARGVERHALERAHWAATHANRVSPTCDTPVAAVSLKYETAIRTVGVAP